MKELLKKIGKLFYAIASFLYTFIEGSITPGIIAFMLKFWFGFMKPQNEDELPTIADSPASVWAFLSVMAGLGTINVLLQKLYIIPKAQHLATSNVHTHRLEHMRLEIERCIEAIKVENQALNDLMPNQKLMLKQFTAFASSLVENINPESLNPEYINSLLHKSEKDFTNSFTTAYLKLHKIDVNRKYLSPQMAKSFESELELVKKDTRAAHIYMFNGVRGWIAIGGLTSFALVGNFGIPVVFAMTIHALLQDLLVLPHGEDIIYTIISAAFISCFYHGYTSAKNLLNQKKTENNLLLHNANLFDECANALEKVFQELNTNYDSKVAIRKLLSLPEGEESMEKTPFEFGFELFQNVQMQNPNTLQHRLIEKVEKEENVENEGMERSSLMTNNEMSTNNYGTNRQYIQLSSVF